MIVLLSLVLELFYSLWYWSGNGPDFGVALLDQDGDATRFECDRFSAVPLRRVSGGGLGRPVADEPDAPAATAA
jgi:hypothetical protein